MSYVEAELLLKDSTTRSSLACALLETFMRGRCMYSFLEEPVETIRVFFKNGANPNMGLKERFISPWRTVLEHAKHSSEHQENFLILFLSYGAKSSDKALGELERDVLNKCNIQKKTIKQIKPDIKPWSPERKPRKQRVITTGRIKGAVSWMFK